MPKSKSKQTARAVFSGGLPKHPGMDDPSSLLRARMGQHPEPLRLPDAYAQPTCATVLKDEYTITTDAQGNFAFGEVSQLAQARVTTPVDVAGVLGARVYTAHPRLTTFVAETRAARMVMIKISLKYIGREDATSGYLSYDQFSGASEMTGSINSIHTDGLVQVEAEEGIEVHGTFTQEPRWEVASDLTFMNNTFQVNVFVGSGLPASTAVYRVRVWRYMEYLPANGVVSEGSMAYEPYDPTALAVHQQLGHVNASVTTAKGGKNGLKEMANAALHMAAPVGRWMVGEAKQALQKQAMRSFASYAARSAPLLLGA